MVVQAWSKLANFPFTGQRVKEIARVLMRKSSPCHCYLVIFHPFVEQLTVFHISGLVLASSSVLEVLDLDLHCDGIMSGMCQTYISIVNPLRTYIQAQPQTMTPLVPTVPA